MAHLVHSAAVLLKRARKPYITDDIGLDLVNTVYALDSTTIDLCLLLLPSADFRSTNAAVKMDTLLDLRGPIPGFIHVSNGKMDDALALDLITATHQTWPNPYVFREPSSPTWVVRKKHYCECRVKFKIRADSGHVEA